MSALKLNAILLCGRGKPNSAYEQLRAHGIQVHCLYPERDPECPQRGVWAAHDMALQTAKRNNWLPCIIFEDNVAVTEDFDAEKVNQALDYALEQQPSGIFLSRFVFCGKRGPVLVSETERDDVVELHPESVTGTSAWVATERSLELWPQWNDQHLDQSMTYWPKRLALRPMPFVRSPQIVSINRWTLGASVSAPEMPSWLSNGIRRYAPSVYIAVQHYDSRERMSLVLAKTLGLTVALTLLLIALK